MLRGFSSRMPSDYRRRFVVTLLLVNVSLVVLAAVWRHAAADDPELGKSSAAEPSATAALQVETPQESQPAAATASGPLRADPVLDELKKVIREPGSELDIPRLDESSPLETRVVPRRSDDTHSDLLLQQRMQSVHALSTAALALVREARSLSQAGMTAESDVLMHHVRQLRTMIAELAAEADGQP